MERLLFMCLVWSLTASRGADDFLPAPTALTYIWMDSFTLMVSWKWEKPPKPQEDFKVKYQFDATNMEGVKKTPLRTLRISHKHHTDSFLTEAMGSTGQILVTIQALSKGLRSPTRNITVSPRKPRDELVKDFKCFIYNKTMNCSWIPTDPSLNLTVSYRYCGKIPEVIKSLKHCEQHHSSGETMRCFMEVDPREGEVCVLVESDARLQTFKPRLVVPVPKGHVTEDGDRLSLSWTPPEVGRGCNWNYNVCYTECGVLQTCENFKVSKTSKEPFKVPYIKSCLYEFEFHTSGDDFCRDVQSNGRGKITYGVSTPLANPLTSMIGVAAAVSVSLCVTIILSAYCCQRHKHVLCPTIPDPSAIFKETMMNGRKDFQSSAEILYTHVPQLETTCKITVVMGTMVSEKADRTI